VNLNAIEMSRPAAIAAFNDYRKAIKGRHFKEDEELLRGYRELAKGRRLISLTEALTAGGTMPVTYANSVWRNQRWERVEQIAQLPKLAIAESDARQCILDLHSDGSGVFWSDRTFQRRKETGNLGAGWVAFPTNIFEARQVPAHRTIVPLVPVHLRPERGLGGYHVLFEVEQWTQAQTVRVGGDPALLKHIGGDLWAVIATWDLSPLEKLILMGRG
jgi:hypothetical protein